MRPGPLTIAIWTAWALACTAAFVPTAPGGAVISVSLVGAPARTVVYGLRFPSPPYGPPPRWTWAQNPASGISILPVWMARWRAPSTAEIRADFRSAQCHVVQWWMVALEHLAILALGGLALGDALRRSRRARGDP